MLYLAKRANAHQETKALAAPIKALAVAIRAAADALEDAELDVEAATAQIEVLDAELSKSFRPLTLALDTLVDGSATDPRRRRLFAQTPSEALGETVGEGQNQFVKDVLKVLADDPDFAALGAHSKPIALAHAALTAKIGERSDLQAQVAVVDSAQTKTVQAGCAGNNEAEPDIKKAVGASNKKLVERFFYKFPNNRRKKPVT